MTSTPHYLDRPGDFSIFIIMDGSGSGSDHAQSGHPGPSKKRSRTISNLTEEQIQHKRNVDRRAQRAFRQRTKDCIVNLEQQFSQLQETANQREQELLAAREQNKSLTNYLEAILELVSTALSHSRHVARPSEGSGRRILPCHVPNC